MKIKFKHILSALLVAATAKVSANPVVDSIPNLNLPVGGNNAKRN